jgi:VanZ family protein
MTPQQTDQERSAIRVQRWIFAFYLVFVVYGSLVPLDFRNRPVGEAFGILLGLRDQPLNFSSRTDWATNLMLFIPLTFLAMQSFASRSTGLVKVLIGLLVVVLGSALAVAIEFTQIFFPSRTPSQNDIVALSIGSAIGVAAQWWLGVRVEQWIKGYWSRQRSEEKVARLLKGYLFILLGFSVLPLDLTISPVEVYHKWREGHVILLPFGGLKGGVADMLYQVLTDILIWIPAGLLWALQRRQGIWRVARDGLLAGAVVELLQLFVMSRTTDITSVLMAGAGSAIGAWLAQRPGRKGQISGGAWRVWWCVWALLVLATFWFPFDFEASRFSFDALQQAFLRAPLTTYYGNSELMAVNEVLGYL